jgi:hypothetical protein
MLVMSSSLLVKSLTQKSAGRYAFSRLQQSPSSKAEGRSDRRADARIAMQPTQRPSNDAISPRLIEMAGRQLLEVGWIPPRYERALRDAIRRADRAEKADRDFYLRGRR